MLQVLAEVMGPESVVKLMLPVVIGLADDSVANIRFNVAKTLKKIAPVLDKKYKVLHLLLNETVAFFGGCYLNKSITITVLWLHHSVTPLPATLDLLF